MGHYPDRSDFSKERKDLIERLESKLNKLDYDQLKSIHVFIKRLDFYLKILKPWFGKY